MAGIWTWFIKEFNQTRDIFICYIECRKCIEPGQYEWCFGGGRLLRKWGQLKNPWSAGTTALVLAVLMAVVFGVVVGIWVVVEGTRFAFKLMRAMGRAADAAEYLLAERKREEEKKRREEEEKEEEKSMRGRRVSEVIKEDLEGEFRGEVGEGGKRKRS